jgi:hypothetical protein
MKRVLMMAGGLMILAWSAGAAAQDLVLREGTPIHVETRNEISSKTARAGDRIALVVAAPVVVDGVTVVPAGAPAWGEVSRSRGNGLLGRSGKLEIKVSEVSAGGRHIPVRGQRNSKGHSGTIGAVGAGVVFLPLAIIVHGQEAKIRAGTGVDVFVDHDVPVEIGNAPREERPIVAPPPQ